MDINELENYRLSDAVKFNDRLNPRIWGSDEKMRPEVREKLLAIADDFREFLGITDLNVKDITVSGSNAAFTYTPHSDVDLHLVVDLPKADISDVYRELFDAKKYQYNDQHDYKIGPYDVELYVQNANQPHVSQGIYSIKDNDWVRVPTKRRSTVDDISVRSKYEDMGHRIEKAIVSGDLAVMDRMAQRVADMRKSGLATTGEFGPENLAFKALRSTGVLDNLRQARQAAKSKKFSLAERDRARPRKVYGYKNYWFPGYDYYDHSDDSGGLEESKQVEFKTGRTVSLEKIVEKFVAFCARRLGLHTVPTITLVSDPGFGADQKTMGHYMDDKRAIEVETGGRHILDILRTVAHELVHYRQHEADDLPHNAGDTGSRWENEAHAVAGVLMRHFDRAHPEYFKARVVDQADEDYDPNGTPPGPEFKPTMPAGTVRVDVSDVYDWYKLGQHISNLKGLGQHDFGKGPPSTIFSFGSEPEEHKYIKNLEKTGLTTTDVDPVDKNQPAGMKKQKVDPTYNVNEKLNPEITKPGFRAEKTIKTAKGPMKLVATTPAETSEVYPQFFIKAYNSDGKAVGNLRMSMRDLVKLSVLLPWPRKDYKNSFLIAGDVSVSDDYRRMGIASEMYKFAKELGNDIRPSPVQTAAGKAMWKGFEKNKVIDEAFNQPYPLKWEKSMHGDYDALARLEDGTYLSIMFNNEYKKNWMVEFYRNNSQALTGEGDAQRIFATVLTAIQQFIKKKKPASLFFSAVKEDDPNGSRTKLYDRLVQRYAGNLGYDIEKQQHPGQMAYKLIRRAAVTEATGYIPVNSKEARDPRYSMAITQDIKPGEVQRQAKKMGFTTDAAGVPPTLSTSGRRK